LTLSAFFRNLPATEGIIMRTMVAVLALLASSAFAQGATKPEECAAIEDSLQRLNCFDGLFPRSAQAAAPAKAESAAAEESAADVKWVFNEDKSPMDDSVRLSAGLIPRKVSYTGIGDGEAFLLLRCHENKTSIVLSTNMFMMDDGVSVTTRLGEEKATTSRWTRSSDYKAVGLWDGGKAIPFIRALATKNTLVVRVEAKDRLDAEFDLGNVAEAAQKVAGACKWKVEG
jgi:type VI secretion system protein VasI